MIKRVGVNQALSSLREAKPGKAPRRFRRDTRGFDRALDDVKERFETKKWDDATPETMLGLYIRLHEHNYKVYPDELKQEWFPALSMCRRVFEQEFANDPIAMVEFIRWTWQRSRKRQQRNPDNDFRIKWRYQFSASLLTDYRVYVRGRSQR